MKHLEILHHPKNASPHVVRYAENWRRVRTALREQKKTRPGEKLTVRRIHPESRWILRAYTYADLRHFDRDRKREENHHPFKP